MNLTYQDLVPYAEQNLLDGVQFKLPLTPFFIGPGGRVNARTRGFFGKDFYLQFRPNGATGTDAYRTFTSVDHDANRSPTKWDGSRTRSYAYNTETNHVTVQTVVDGNPAIGAVNPTSATHATQGTTTHNPPDHVEITLSQPVTKGWLADELTRWSAESEEFRNATGGGLGTYAYTGHGATRSESDGYLATVGGGEVEPLGYTFLEDEAFGMVGDEAELWNGNYSTWVNLIRRKNAPVIYQDGSASPVAAGRGIYRNGYTEISVSEPLGNVWMDDYGVFQASDALAGVPMMAANGYEFGNLLSYADDGEAHELTLLSRTGKPYRVTLQTGSYDWNGHWITSGTRVVTINPVTLRATLTFGESGENANSVRVSRIEEGITVDDVTEWKTVASVFNGDDPNALIGPSVAGGFLLLAAIKKRAGSRFGFPSLDYATDPDTRYRKQAFKLQLTPGTYHGGGVSGAADLEYAAEFDADTGLLKPRTVTLWEVTINGQDWTPESFNGWDNSYFPGSVEAENNTATVLRREGSHETTGSFFVALDAPDPAGKILSSEWQKVVMTFANALNRGMPVDLDPPTSGQSLFFGGHRLTYNPTNG